METLKKHPVLSWSFAVLAICLHVASTYAIAKAAYSDPPQAHGLGRLERASSTPPDTDADGLPNVSDPDIDGDGLPNGSDSNVDGGFPKKLGVIRIQVGDSLANDDPRELDIDGDGMADTSASEEDIDGDGLPDIAPGELDEDGDSVPDELDQDIDGDNANNISDPDMDGDGLSNLYDEAPDGLSHVFSGCIRRPHLFPLSRGKVRETALEEVLRVWWDAVSAPIPLPIG